jgi:hypothetical protein
MLCPPPSHAATTFHHPVQLQPSVVPCSRTLTYYLPACSSKCFYVWHHGPKCPRRSPMCDIFAPGRPTVSIGASCAHPSLPRVGPSEPLPWPTTAIMASPTTMRLDGRRRWGGVKHFHEKCCYTILKNGWSNFFSQKILVNPFGSNFLWKWCWTFFLKYWQHFF